MAVDCGAVLWGVNVSMWEEFVDCEGEGGGWMEVTMKTWLELGDWRLGLAAIVYRGWEGIYIFFNCIIHAHSTMTIQGRVCLIHLILSCRIARCYLQVLVQYILVHLIILRRTNGTIDIKITCPCLLLNLADGVNQDDSMSPNWRSERDVNIDPEKIFFDFTCCWSFMSWMFWMFIAGFWSTKCEVLLLKKSKYSITQMWKYVFSFVIYYSCVVKCHIKLKVFLFCQFSVLNYPF